MKYGDLRGILQYVPQFRGRTFVVALDGDVLATRNFPNILLDLAVLRSLNVRIVLVHGAARQIRALAEKRGVPLSNSDGTGVTDDATLEVSLDAITRLSNSVMQNLTAIRVRAATANAVIAHPAGIIGGVDRQHTGTIDRIDTGVLESFLDQEILPVVPPIGYDGSGRTLRVNSDAVAMEVAISLKASKIIFLTTADPDFGEAAEGRRQFDANAAEALRLAVQESVPPGLFSKLRHAIRACREGVARVHIVNGKRDDALLAELFSNEGVGVMVFADAYRKVRPATRQDVDEMLLMMRQAVEDEMLVERTREEILNRLTDYAVMEIDGNIVGCVAVHGDPEAKACEVACLYTKRAHEGLGYGRRLVAEAEKMARQRGAGAVFALSTQTAGFFERLGYRRQSGLSIVPDERRERWEKSGRNALLLVKDLGD
ncbi:MAG: amino-acid N-acetyltransferase [Verrucomicrobiae bacterium]|nr:amino-acid N-acetyltransferase [Verrucomicrobiae bacterium]MCP5541286.1 amino-acid N-acetyltransferase [Akkermansiaceae bacterium]MCP5550951.1 amino-acid N-acetyltransferase [Akkermansiaceae bacterium]